MGGQIRTLGIVVLATYGVIDKHCDTHSPRPHIPHPPRGGKRKGVRPPVLAVDAPPEGGSALLSRSSQYHRRARA